MPSEQPSAPGNGRLAMACPERDKRIWLVMALAFGVMFAVQAVLPELATTIFSDELAPTMQAILVVSPLLPMACLGIFFGHEHIASGGSAAGVAAAVAIGATVFALSCLLGLGCDGLGMAMAAVFGGTGACVALVRLVYNGLSISHYVKAFGPFCVIGALMYCVIRLFALLIHDAIGAGIAMIAIESAIGIAFYVLALWYWSAKTGSREFAAIFGRAAKLPRALHLISLTDKHNAALEPEHFAIRQWLEDAYSGPMAAPLIGALDVRHRKMVASGLTYGSYAIWLFFAILYQSFFARFIPIYAINAACFALLFAAEAIAVGRDRRTLAANAAMLAFVMLATAAFPYSIAWGGTIVVFAFYARNYKLDDFARMSLIVTALAVYVVMVSARAGIIESRVEYGGRVRHLMGFLGALYPPMYMFVISLLTVYLSKRNLGFTKAFALFIPNYFLLSYTDSRLSFVLSVMVIAVSLLVSYLDRTGKRGRLRPKILVPVFGICFLVSAIATLAYDPASAFWAAANEAAGSRLSLAHDGLLRYGVTAFGQDVGAAGNGLNPYGICETMVYDYIDNAYIKLLVRWGIVWTAAYLVLWTASMRFACDQDDPYLAMCLVIIALHCLIDDLCLLLSFNPFFLVAGVALRRFLLQRKA